MMNILEENKTKTKQNNFELNSYFCSLLKMRILLQRSSFIHAGNKSVIFLIQILRILISHSILASNRFQNFINIMSIIL